MLNSILVTNDGSEGGFKALAFALDLARVHGSRLHMICVEELPDFPASIDEVVEEKMEANGKFNAVTDRAQRLARLKDIDLEVHVVVGRPVQTVVEFVKSEGIEHLVVGFMGHTALYDRIIGGTAERLIRLAPCSVTVVK